MVIPVYDDADENPLRPWVTWILVGLTTLVTAFSLLLTTEDHTLLAINFGVVSDFVLNGPPADAELLVPPILTTITYLFMHGSWFHLVANAIVLWVFGDNVETACGHLKFLLLYLLCGIAGAVAHLISNPSTTVPLIGASGAVAGIGAAYLLLRPRAHVILLVFGVMTVNLRAYWVVGIWAITQIGMFLILEQPATVVFWPHVAGFAAGLLLIVLLRRKDVQLLEGWHPRLR